MSQARAGWPRIMQFRPPGGVKRKHYVPGGRWQVRKVIDHRMFSAYRGERRWKATTIGRARAFERYFATWAEAIEWAQFVARLFCEGHSAAQGRYYEMVEPYRQRKMEWLYQENRASRGMAPLP